ncbi:MAG: RHS repeat-associated core domain-containing protein [Saprospiraceae bacterium]|nr:RHS repeat-associated core domain-containing protein [Saprospiraceae bacterium]
MQSYRQFVNFTSCKSIFIRLYLLGFCLLIGQSLFASEEVYYGCIRRQQLQMATPKFEVSDTFPTTGVDQVLSTKAFVFFSIDGDTLLKPGVTVSYFVKCKIERFDQDNNSIGVDTAVILSINYNPNDGSTFQGGRVFELSSTYLSGGTPKFVHRIVITVTGKSSNFPAFLKLEGKIIINRKYTFTCSAAPVLIQKTYAKLYNAVTNSYRIGWNKQLGAEEYDFEWAFYDTLGPMITLAAGNAFDFNFVFANNATRITTGQSFYDIPLVYPQGRIYWRVRGARYKNGLRETGTWSTYKGVSNGTLLVGKEWYWVNQHEPNLNWQMQTVYAEEGKRSQSATYFDGTLRGRQKVAKSDASDVTIASESIYDSLGRAAMVVMPAPVSTGVYTGGSTDLWRHKIQYNASFSAVNGGTNYLPPSFDGNLTGCSSSSSNPAAKMDTVNGIAARYYSANNPWRDRPLGKFIPAADGFPFALTEFMADPTGRARRQGGFGATFQLGSGHESKLYYSKPDQRELDRLFGNEAGLAAHYQKNATKDANGQMSIAYIDAHGRTVATCLAGDLPGTTQLEKLPNFAVVSRVKSDLLNNIREDYALRSSATLLVTNVGSDTFTYMMSSKLEYSTDTCMAALRCFDCKYDLEITVLDECGTALLTYTKSNFNYSQAFDTLCVNGTLYLPDTLFLSTARTLPVGQYQVSKTLRINNAALNYYADDYVKHLTCIPKPANLSNLFLGDTTCNTTCASCSTRIGSRLQFKNNFLLGITNPTPQDTLNASKAFDLAIKSCTERCNNSDPGDCGMMRDLMLLDMNPGGQYAKYNKTNVLSSGDSITVFTASTDVTSIFYKSSPSPTIKYPYQRTDSIGSYRDEYGKLDTLFLLDSIPVTPDQLTINEFITYFKPSWANNLIYLHPEYCYYKCCLSNTDSTWDATFSSVETYAAAVTAGYMPNITNLFNADPFLNSNGTIKSSIDSLWNINYTYTGTTLCRSAIPLKDILISIAYCNGTFPCPVTPGGGCTADNDMYWQIVKREYLSQRSRLKWAKIRGSNCNTSNPTNPYCRTQNQLCFGQQYKICSGQSGTLNPYWKKTSRMQSTISPPIPVAGVEDTIQSMLVRAYNELNLSCDSTCMVNADQWMQKLSATCTTLANATQAKKDTIRARFIRICKSGCDVDHPFGSITTNGAGIGGPYNEKSLDQVLLNELSISTCDTGCSARNITFPGTFSNRQYNLPQTQIFAKDTCRCNRLNALVACWGQSKLLSGINASSDVKLTAAQLSTLQSSCTADCKYMSGEIVIPPILECNTCKTATEIKTAWTSFLSPVGCIGTVIDNVGEQRLITGYMNQLFGLNRSYADYLTFVNYTDSLNCRFLCPLSRTTVNPAMDTACLSQDLIEGTTSLGYLAYANLLDSMRREFTRKYVGKCLGQSLVEVFNVTLPDSRYQYTLYYYDQAGNLVRTIPPKGVNQLTSTPDLNAVIAYRANPNLTPKYPPHNFNSRYWYNTLNQVVRDSTPDHGVSNYWYDKLGRQVLAQNAQQRPTFDYSYSKYDALGRVIETGRIRKLSTDTVLYNTIWDYTSFNTWLGNANKTGLFEVTQTYYDDIIPGGVPNLDTYFSSAGQENLRNRIASVTYEETKDASHLTYNYATHYSYDIHGNVKKLVQDMPELATVGHRFKRIAYDYDLVSGKVNYVYYQADSIDQFVHHYVYDADNRLQFVETSRDKLIWERDANYEYYLHGPLCREEIGERRVQGLDYAYTLQGWLKAVNAGTLQTDTQAPSADFSTRDMGLDGKSGNTGYYIRNKTTGRDVLGFTLGYYQGDYRRLSPTSTDAFEIKYNGATAFNQNGPDLFNGNIRHAVYAIAKLNLGSGIPQSEAYTYRYDQLNRLTKMRVFNKYTKTNLTWDATGPNIRYRETVKYDPNGNILNYSRYGNDSLNLIMDSLKYQYSSTVSNNKLLYIDDSTSVASTTYPLDLDDQVAGNYAYDRIGNLTQDTKDSINSITWTNWMKIAAVNKTNRSISFKYNPMQQRVAKYVKPTSSTAEKRTYYIRDAQGNVMAVYTAKVTNNSGTITWDTFYLSEQHLYGSNRLGLAQINVKLYPGTYKNPHLADSSNYAIFEGWKRYELTNHLGNVLAVISDRKIGKSTGTYPGPALWYEADVLSTQQYYPFGMLMPGRQHAVGSYDYRYGFNGKEGDDEVKGDDNQQDYGMRIYDPRVGRFLSVDPITKQYPELTPYQFASNTPIQAIDLDGLERYHYTLLKGFNGGPILIFDHAEHIIDYKRSVTDIFWNAVTFNILSRKPKLIIDAREEFVVHSYYTVGTFPFDETTEKSKTYRTRGETLDADKDPDLNFSFLDRGAALITAMSNVGMLTTGGGGIGKILKPTGPGIYVYTKNGAPYFGRIRSTWFSRYKKNKDLLEKGADHFIQVKGNADDLSKRGGLLEDIENALINHNGGPKSAKGPIVLNKRWNVNKKDLEESINNGEKWLDENVADWKNIFDYKNKKE